MHVSTPDLLRAAAEEVRKGWTRFVREDALGNVCALGALDRVTGVRDYVLAWSYVELAHPDLVAALARAIGNASPDAEEQSVAIADWNNAGRQTAANVAATLEFAALCVDQARTTTDEHHEDLLTRGDRRGCSPRFGTAGEDEG